MSLNFHKTVQRSAMERRRRALQMNAVAAPTSTANIAPSATAASLSAGRSSATPRSKRPIPACPAQIAAPNKAYGTSNPAARRYATNTGDSRPTRSARSARGETPAPMRSNGVAITASSAAAWAATASDAKGRTVAEIASGGSFSSAVGPRGAGNRRRADAKPQHRLVYGAQRPPPWARSATMVQPSASGSAKRRSPLCCMLPQRTPSMIASRYHSAPISSAMG